MYGQIKATSSFPMGYFKTQFGKYESFRQADIKLKNNTFDSP